MMHWYGPRTLDSRFRCDYELGRAGNERFGFDSGMLADFYGN